MKEKILILEDEPRMCRLLELVVREPGYRVRTAGDGHAGMQLWREWQPDLVISDLKMPKADGLDVLRFRNHHFPAVPFILLTAFGTVQTAVAAMKEGAFDYLTKPVDHHQLLELIERALASVRIDHDDPMIGSSPVMQDLRREIGLAARTDSAVLITGESGTGKELAARAVHQLHSGGDAPFIRVNCPAIPGDLLESELFGHRRGAFTGAVADHHGAFNSADSGTLFLDEIGDLPLSLQPKLLHAVEEKMITPVGGARPVSVQVKIIAATNQNLEAMVEQGLFRRDLYYRLSIIRLEIAPLRERCEDIPALASYFVEKFCTSHGLVPLTLEPETLDLLQAYSWPGNIRELRNVIERICLRTETDSLTSDLLPKQIQQGKTALRDCRPSDTENQATMDLTANERDLILQALVRCDWNQSKAARELGITRNTLRYRIKKHGLNRPG